MLTCPWRLQRRWRHTLSRLYQPKELIPHSDLGTAKKIEEITSNSARLLIEYGIIKSTGPGYFALLPLATRSLNKLVKLIEEELEGIGCQRIQLPHVAPGALWSKSGRWKSMGPELVRFKDRHNKDMVLSPTHEESMTQLVSTYNLSVRELPLRLYQVGSKFRAEMRPRFGLIRANEFIMKDLYTFDKSLETAEYTYQQVTEAYSRIFSRIGVPFQRVEGDTGTIGGSLSHEFHYPADIGQDELLWCPTCRAGKNKELSTTSEDDQTSTISKDDQTSTTSKEDQTLTANEDQGSSNCLGKCDSCGGGLQLTKGIEVGHTFLLGQKYSKVFKAEFTGEAGKGEVLEMGCYGIGVTRVLAAALEVLSTPTELRWPRLLAPFSICIITPKIGSKEYSGLSLLEDLHSRLDRLFPNDVIVDDRAKVSIGKKQHEANRTGYPIIVVIGKKSVDPQPLIELHLVAEKETEELSPNDLVQRLAAIHTRYSL